VKIPNPKLKLPTLTLHRPSRAPSTRPKLSLRLPKRAVGGSKTLHLPKFGLHRAQGKHQSLQGSSKQMLPILLLPVVALVGGYMLLLKPAMTALPTSSAAPAAQTLPQRSVAASPGTLRLAKLAIPVRVSAPTLQRRVQAAASAAHVQLGPLGTAPGPGAGAAVNVGASGSTAALSRFLSSLQTVTLSHDQLSGNGELMVALNVTLTETGRGANLRFTLFAPAQH
jgi:hypothetical protein